MVSRRRRRGGEEGQAVVEYILLIAVIVSLFVTFMRGLSDIGVMNLVMRPIQEDFARAYMYGHPKAKGLDDGGPEKHVRAGGGGSSFRMFLNPSQR